VVIPKPKKDCHTVKAYRPIALLETLGKIIEKLVATRISKLAEEHKLFPDLQMGGRPKKSTITALETLTETVHKVWQSGGKYVATAVSLDMSGAFDNVSHPRLIHILRQKKIPSWIIEFVKSFLARRQSTITLDN
jgi:hypothetical protein